MKHLGTEWDREAVCMFVDDKMNIIEIADPLKGEEITCPRCLALAELYD